MAGIIKNQILKHLSRFVKNLTSDKINVSTFKGEGELNNLNLDENVLTELLALPIWMKLTYAHCDRATLRIQWTKLKSIPIHLNLDKVTIHVEACEELRQSSANPMFSGYSGKYGFVNKVIDGITASVNSVEIIFQSKGFQAEVKILQIYVESRRPNWEKGILPLTRLKDLAKGEVLIFKELTWQTLRLEARSISDRHLAPLRLLTNQAKARITIKKRILDCQVVGCRLSLILDDLLWVFTDSQILASLHFTNSLSGLIKKATEITQRVKAARKLESLPEYLQSQLSHSSTLQSAAKSKNPFDYYDVKETSYHFNCEKIELHFSDDDGNGRSEHPDLKDGGAIQLTLTRLTADFYPYHLTRSTRDSWQMYQQNNPPFQWLQTALNAFRIDTIELLSESSMHTPLTRTVKHPHSQTQTTPSSIETPSHFIGTSNEQNQMKLAVNDQLAKLMSTCLVLRINDLSLFKVTTSSKREAPKPFISSYIKKPKDLPVIHAEFSWFYYPGEICFPLPSPKIYVHSNPIQVNLDTTTILWLNSFISHLQISLLNINPEEEEEENSTPDYVDIRIELIMPKVVFENREEYKCQKERPSSVHLQTSRLVLSNYRSNKTGTLHQLTQCLEILQRGDLGFASEFPSYSKDLPLIPEKFVRHAEGQDKVRSPFNLKCSSFLELAPNLSKEILWTEARDVWYVSLEPFWADFRVEQKRKGGGSIKRPFPSKDYLDQSLSNANNPPTTILYPFIDTLNLSAWIYLLKGPKGLKNIHVLFHTPDLANVQLTHYEYLFLLRMTEAFSEISLYLSLDLKHIVGEEFAFKNVLTLLGTIPSLELSLLFPPLILDKHDSTSMDLDSTIPESSSGENVNEEQEVSVSENIGHWKINNANEEKKINNLGLRLGEQQGPVSLSVSFGGLSQKAIQSNITTSVEVLKSNFAAGVKHSLSNVSNIAVSFNKSGIGLLDAGLSTPDSEVASIASLLSNLSSDESENNFVHIEHLNNLNGTSSPLIDEEGVEIGTEVIEEKDGGRGGSNSPYFPIHNSNDNLVHGFENDNQIGVLTMKCSQLEIAEEVKGVDSIIKAALGSLSLRECTGISWNEFQKSRAESRIHEKKFTERSIEWKKVKAETRNFNSTPNPKKISARINQHIDLVKFDKMVKSDEIKSKKKFLVNLSDTPGEKSPMRACIVDTCLVNIEACANLSKEDEIILHMSSVIGLADLFEDEIVPVPFPIKLEICGVTFTLIDDRPSMNITSPGPVPLKICIPENFPISRDIFGVFFFGKTEQNGGKLGESAVKDEMSKLKESLEKTFRSLESTRKRNEELEKELYQMEQLKLMIMDLQEQVNKLQKEKKSHLDVINAYQNINKK